MSGQIKSADTDSPCRPQLSKLDSAGHLVEYYIMAIGITPYLFGVSIPLPQRYLSGTSKLCLRPR